MKHLVFRWLIVAPLLLFAQSEKPALVYTTGETVNVAAVSGAILKSFPLPFEAGNFTVSPDGSRVVLVRPTCRNGGALYSLDLSSGALERLTRSPLFRHKLEPREMEVYDDPEFSPSGREIVFAIHYYTLGSDANDIVDSAGPLATMDLKTRRAKILKATADVQGLGPAFPTGPHWSPDGSRILVDLDATGFILDAGGHKMQELVPSISSDSWASLLEWYGNSCILYQAGDQGGVHTESGLRLLHLDNRKSTAAATIPGIPDQLARRVVSIQFTDRHTLVISPVRAYLFDNATHKLLWKAPSRHARVTGPRPAALKCP